jgi:hypothetical protein
VSTNDYNFADAGAYYYLRVCVRSWRRSRQNQPQPEEPVALSTIQDRKLRLTPDGREVYGQWATLANRFKQLELDAVNVLPYFIHGILVIDYRRQRALELRHPRSSSIRYSFFDIACAFHHELRKAPAHRPIGPLSKYLYSLVPDQDSLDMFRELVWDSPKNWDEHTNTVAGLKWPPLLQGDVRPGIDATISPVEFKTSRRGNHHSHV